MTTTELNALFKMFGVNAHAYVLQTAKQPFRLAVRTPNNRMGLYYTYYRFFEAAEWESTAKELIANHKESSKDYD